MKLVDRSSGLPRRPRLMVEAARFGQSGYDRDRKLPEILGRPVETAGGWHLSELIDLETAQENLRRARAPGYSIERHMDILIALIAEYAAIGRQAFPGVKQRCTAPLKSVGAP